MERCWPRHDGLVIPGSVVGPTDMDAQPRPVDTTVPRKRGESLLASARVSEPMGTLVPRCVDDVKATESSWEATFGIFGLTLAELLLSPGNEDVLLQVVEVEMGDRSMVELSHALL